MEHTAPQTLRSSHYKMSTSRKTLRFIDLFCGIGGFHLGVDSAGKALKTATECVWASDIDEWARLAYETNFALKPVGDIVNVEAESVPDHDLLCAGFPCQPFSVFGKMNGFADTRGTLFFDIARILKAKRSPLFVLENVKQLVSHKEGLTLQVIKKTLTDLGYQHDHRVLDARDFGLPQKRERVIIVGRHRDHGSLSFDWPEEPRPMKPLSEILEKEPSKKSFASEKIRQSRREKVSGKIPDGAGPFIYHENKSGNVSVYPYSCALRAGSSYNYLLVDGQRRLTGREMMRLQGFPDDYQLTCSYSQTRKQAGNAVPVPIVSAVVRELIENNF